MTSPFDIIREALPYSHDHNTTDVVVASCPHCALTEVEHRLADRPITTQEHHLLLIEIRDLTARAVAAETALAEANQRAVRAPGPQEIWTRSQVEGMLHEQAVLREAAEQRANALADALREIAECTAMVKPGHDGHPVIVVRRPEDAVGVAVSLARAALDRQEQR